LTLIEVLQEEVMLDSRSIHILPLMERLDKTVERDLIHFSSKIIEEIVQNFYEICIGWVFSRVQRVRILEKVLSKVSLGLDTTSLIHHFEHSS